MKKQLKSFNEVIQKYSNLDIQDYFKKIKKKDIINSIHKENLNELDFLNLLSPKAQNELEEMATRANELTNQFFGRTIGLYIPLYISNYCESECIYCGFNRKNSINRLKLSHEEIEKELQAISKTGMQHILLLTGESPTITPLEYIKKTVEIAKKYFASISIEMYPMKETDYKELKESGVDGLTIYQEVYDKKIYEEVHLAGEKKDFHFRLNTPERAAKAEIPFINIGTLFGLGEKHMEAFLSGLHAKYLQDKYLDSLFSLSLPRLNNAEGHFTANFPVNDKTYVQFMLAYRIFLPKIGINISTRESAEFRKNILPLGVTKFSAGSVTEVGGYSDKKKKNTPQFEISDNRDVDEIVNMLKSMNYQPIYKDWEVLS